jgi:hypothetical protein
MNTFPRNFTSPLPLFLGHGGVVSLNLRRFHFRPNCRPNHLAQNLRKESSLHPTHDHQTPQPWLPPRRRQNFQYGRAKRRGLRSRRSIPGTCKPVKTSKETRCNSTTLRFHSASSRHPLPQSNSIADSV